MVVAAVAAATVVESMFVWIVGACGDRRGERDHKEVTADGGRKNGVG